MSYSTFISTLGALLGDLFKIWSYSTFGVILAMCGVYMAVKIVGSLFRL